jgi:uncharacterized protein (DUF2336 family)
MAPPERNAAHVAMTYLLDDPSPRVRLALAEALADSSMRRAPDGVSVEDQPEIASLPILRSPVLSDSDLVDLAGRGSGVTRALIAARPGLSRAVAGALAEIGDAEEVVVLLENQSASIARLTLKRIAERHGGHDCVRSLLLDRPDLPAAVRQLLVQFVADALSGSAFVRAAIGARRIKHHLRGGQVATIAILGSSPR